MNGQIVSDFMVKRDRKLLALQSMSFSLKQQLIASQMQVIFERAIVGDFFLIVLHKLGISAEGGVRAHSFEL